MSDVNLVPDPVWADSEDYDQLYIMWQIKYNLGIIVYQEDKNEEPAILFCSLFDKPDRIFYEGKKISGSGVKISELKSAIGRIDKLISDRPLRVGHDSNGDAAG